MATTINFPSSPTIGQLYVYGVTTYVWEGTRWSTKLQITDDVISGSLRVTNGITGSLFGTASYAITASYAQNAGVTVNTGSLLVTASAALNVITFTKGNGITFPVTINTGSGGVTGTGTTNYIPKFTGTSAIGNSLLYDNGTTVSVNTTAPTSTFKFEVSGSDIQVNGVRIGAGGGNLNTNAAIGRSALNNNTSGVSNTAIGDLSLSANRTGFGHIAIGALALSATDGGYYNIGIGWNSQTLTATDTYSIVIGAGATGLGSNTTVIGYLGTTLTAIYGNIALGKTTASTRLDISGSALITGSLKVTQGITGSLFGTASNSLSSSFASTASFLNTLNQNVQISGSLKLDPTQDPDPLGLDLDSTVLFQSSSNTALGYDLYFRQNGNLVKWKWVEGNLESGLLYGGVVTYSGSNVFVSPGSGIIAEHNATTGSEISPIINYVTWNAITQSIANIATQQVTYLYIDQNGDLQQQSSRFTAQEYHNYIPLGAVGHFDYTQVSAFGGAVQTAYDQISQTSNFIDAFGPLKISGYGLTGQAGTLQLSVGTGTSFIHGGFYQNDPEFPSQATTPAQATASLARINRSGSTIEFDTNGGNFYTVVDPTKYDRDGDGTLANVGNGNWTIQRVFSDPKTGVLYVYYGQERYTSLLNALQYLSTDPFTEGDTFDFTTFIGFLVLKGNASDITDTADNRILPAGLFRGSGQGSGGGIALSNLDDLTDVSITSPTNGQALVYNSGIWQNGTPISASYATTASSAQGGNGSFSGSFTGSLFGTASKADQVKIQDNLSTVIYFPSVNGYTEGYYNLGMQSTVKYFVDNDTFEAPNFSAGSLGGGNIYGNLTGTASLASSVTPLNQNVVITGSLRGNVISSSITSTTASLNLATSNFFTLTLANGANTHISASNIQPGQTVNIRVTQGSAGTGTVSFNSAIKQSSGSLYTGSMIADAVDVVSLIAFDSTNAYISYINNFV